MRCGNRDDGTAKANRSASLYAAPDGLYGRPCRQDPVAIAHRRELALRLGPAAHVQVIIDRYRRSQLGQVTRDADTADLRHLDERRISLPKQVQAAAGVTPCVVVEQDVEAGDEAIGADGKGRSQIVLEPDMARTRSPPLQPPHGATGILRPVDRLPAGGGPGNLPVGGRTGLGQQSREDQGRIAAGPSNPCPVARFTADSDSLSGCQSPDRSVARARTASRGGALCRPPDARVPWRVGSEFAALDRAEQLLAGILGVGRVGRDDGGEGRGCRNQGEAQRPYHLEPPIARGRTIREAGACVRVVGGNDLTDSRG